MKKHHTKQMAFVAVLLATLTLIGGCGNQEPSDTATESAYRGNDHESRVSSGDASCTN